MVAVLLKIEHLISPVTKVVNNGKIIWNHSLNTKYVNRLQNVRNISTVNHSLFNVM